MGSYLNLLENINELTLSQKRILLGLTTYLTEGELKDLQLYYKKLGIEVIDSLSLSETSINNDKIRNILEKFKSYVWIIFPKYILAHKLNSF